MKVCSKKFIFFKFRSKFPNFCFILFALNYFVAKSSITHYHYSVTADYNTTNNVESVALCHAFLVYEDPIYVYIFIHIHSVYFTTINRRCSSPLAAHRQITHAVSTDEIHQKLQAKDFFCFRFHLNSDR